jgi:TRAP-type C4-dicarboxylate transport system permease small subunit
MPDQRAPSRHKNIEELIFIKMPHVVGGALFVIAVVINIVNVIGRYIFSTPIFWAEEALIYVVIWTVFIVAGSVTYRGAHLNMDLLYSSMPRQMQLAVNIAVLVALIACSLFAAYQAWNIVSLDIKNHSVTAGTDIPLALPTGALVFGFSFMALAAIVRWRSYLSGKFD